MPTDPLAGSELARLSLPDDVYGFGWAELAYLLGRHATPSARMSLAALGFQAAPHDDVVAAAGVASLLARGLAAPEGDRAVSRGEAAVLETVLARGRRWSGVSFREDAGDRGDLLVAVEDGDAIALLQPRSLGTWFVGLTNEVHRPAAALARGIEAMLEFRGSGTFALETRDLQGVLGALYFRPRDGGWLVSDTPEGVQREVARAQLPEELARLLPALVTA
ncbi:hypothetical protein [Terrabacter sp. NPDC080008]|uniref:hypothetical protein n=1 Tax=Terrabacter sp. NPDC080008 TaxID=3155176 RepID=UPI00344F2357